MTSDDVKRMMEAGATLVQVYTGFVYNGLGFAGDLCNGLIAPALTEDIESAESATPTESTEGGASAESTAPTEGNETSETANQ